MPQPLTPPQVSWPHDDPVFPRLTKRLGIVYCFNRSCGLVHCAAPLPPAWAGAAAPSSPAALTPLLPGRHSSAMEPRFSPDGSQLLYVSYDEACASGTHSSAAALHAAAWDGAAAEASHARQVVGVVEAPEAPGCFPGLYSQNLAATLLPPRPFLSAAVNGLG